MSALFDYGPLVLTVLAAFLGIRGETWRGDKKWLKKVSLVGWMAILLASIGLVLGCLAKTEERKMKREATSIAALRIQGCLNDLIVPLVTLHANATGTKPNRPRGDVFDLKLDRFRSPEFLEGLKHVFLKDTFPYVSKRGYSTWAEYIEEKTSSAATEIDKVLMVYIQYLPPDVAIRLERLKTEPSLTCLSDATGLARWYHSEKEYARVPVAKLLYSPRDYEDFLSLLEELSADMRSAYREVQEIKFYHEWKLAKDMYYPVEHSLKTK